MYALLYSIEWILVIRMRYESNTTNETKYNMIKKKEGAVNATELIKIHGVGKTTAADITKQKLKVI